MEEQVEVEENDDDDDSDTNTTQQLIIPTESKQPFLLDPAFADWSSPLDSLDELPSELEQEVKVAPNCIKFIMNVHQFYPAELTIKSGSEPNKNTIIIDGCHEAKASENDHSSSITRSFTRKYSLPSNVIVDEAKANLTSDGVLQIIVPINSSTNSFAVPIPTNTSGDDGSTENIDQIVQKEATRANFIESTPSEKDGAAMESEQEEESHCGALATKAKTWFTSHHYTWPDFHLEPFWSRFGSYDVTASPIFGEQSDSENFRVLINVKGFSPDELSVYATKHFVTIQGRHDDKPDSHGLLARSFIHRFDLPNCICAQDLVAQLMTCGVLEVTAPKLKTLSTMEEFDVEKSIPIVEFDEDKVQF